MFLSKKRETLKNDKRRATMFLLEMNTVFHFMFSEVFFFTHITSETTCFNPISLSFRGGGGSSRGHASASRCSAKAWGQGRCALGFRRARCETSGFEKWMMLAGFEDFCWVSNVRK